MSRKGITPVIGAVLLISISVAASLSAFTFLQDVKNDLKESSEEKIDNQRDKVQKSINLEIVYNGTHGNTIIQVRNTGSEALLARDGGDNIWSLFVDGSPENWKFANSTLESSQDVSLESNKFVKINSTIDYPPANTKQVLQLSGDDISDTHICVHTGSQSC